MSRVVARPSELKVDEPFRRRREAEDERHHERAGEKAVHARAPFEALPALPELAGMGASRLHGAPGEGQTDPFEVQLDPQGALYLDFAHS